MNDCYKMVREFQDKYPNVIAWRLKKHCNIINKHLNPGEELLFAVPGQLNNNKWGFFDSVILGITNERLIIGHKYILPGYKFISITPDLYNDLSVIAGWIWGTLVIDTIKEVVYISNLDKKSLPEVETKITEFMQEAKKKYKEREDEKEKKESK